ncbi:TPA: aldolase catalytic domain-containing protein [Yersinia enterocolitica]|nr:aldolase catalytic domain-containing protein [Yersinia enterocolitica]
MKTINVLDCTLRDGGYVNNWEFGNGNIKLMLRNLTDANVDIIECGFLSNKNASYDKDKSIFDSIERFQEVIPEKRHNSKYVCMINYGEYDIRDIPDFDESSIDGIRVVFHKSEVDEALEFCSELKKKGYLLFIQPMATINYTDEELLRIVDSVNKIQPFAFYIVDSFGVMKKHDLLRMFFLIDNNLEKNIDIGYHSHNNLQLAYSNAQALVEINSTRNRIVDTSVFGMGRGAGNLNTELFIQYLNENFVMKYNVFPLLQIIDQTLSKIYSVNYWGYSLPHYLSAIHNCHPNYASYLSEKNTLTVKAIQEILFEIPYQRRSSFNKAYIEDLYTNYQRRIIDDRGSLQFLNSKLYGQNILLIVPGNSIKSNNDLISNFIDSNNVITLSVNFIPSNFNCDFTFISNKKRYEKLMEIVEKKSEKFIITSNIDTEISNQVLINYSSLLNLNDAVSDNATLMLLKLLVKIGASKVYIAGFDGYSVDTLQNYVDKEMVINANTSRVDELNTSIAKVVNEISGEINLEFLTPSKYADIINKKEGK